MCCEMERKETDMKRISPKRVRKRAVLLALLLLLCVSLCSCSFSLESAMEELKAYINGEEVPQPPEGFVESREGKLYKYDVYRDHIVLTGYLGEAFDVKIPAKIDGLPVRKIAGLTFYEGADIISVTVPEGVTELEENAFYYCTTLISVSLPSTLEKIGDKAFSWCTSLTGITLPEKIREIPAYCFNQCTSLTTVTFSEELVSVGTRAFSGCTSLQSLRFENALTEVGNYAFRGCTSLYRVRLPGDCKLGSEVFTDCASTFCVATVPDSVCWAACTEQGIALLPEQDSSVALPGGESADESADTSGDIPLEEASLD